MAIQVKLPAHRAGLPGNVISFYSVPLDRACKAGLAGHAPVKTTTSDRYSKRNLPGMYHILAVVKLVDDRNAVSISTYNPNNRIFQESRERNKIKKLAVVAILFRTKMGLKDKNGYQETTIGNCFFLTEDPEASFFLKSYTLVKNLRRSGIQIASSISVNKIMHAYIIYFSYTCHGLFGKFYLG